MKLLQTLVSGTGFRDPAHNSVRFALLDMLLAVARFKSADLLMLPGGYLTAESTGDLPALIAAVAERATAANVTVAFGIDLPDAPEGKAAPTPLLPYYGVVSGPASGGPWQQTSSTGANAANVLPANVPGAGRVVTVAGCRVGVLICGELFSWWARQSFAQLALGLALDLGHYGMGTGATAAMQNIATNGTCAVAHTHHVAGWNNQSLHFVQPGGVRESVPLNDCEWVSRADFWAAWCARDV